MTTTIDVTLRDGTDYEMDDIQSEAFLAKYGDDVETALRRFTDAVQHHFENHTVPTKFGWDEEWVTDDQYADHADLASDVLYPAIRVPMMALALQEIGGETEGEEGVARVLALDPDGKATEYRPGDDGVSAIHYDSLHDALNSSGDEL